MLRDNMVELGRRGLATTFGIKNEAIDVGFVGTCDMEGLPYLQPFLDDLHAEAKRTGAKCVVIDCESLYFMNSASIKCFITWLGRVRKLELSQQYTVGFRTNKRLSWQQRTLSAIRRFAPDIVFLDA